MKKIGFLTASASLVALTGWLVMSRGLARSAESAELDAPTAVVERLSIGSTVLATGVIRPQVGAEGEVGSRVSGVLQRLRVTVGDQVLYGKYAGTEIKYQGDEFKILRESEVLGLFE